VVSASDFWSIQVFAAYEADTTDDFDPNLEGAAMGLADFAGSVTVFLETIRDRAAYVGAGTPESVDGVTLRERIAYHELVHKFDLGHDSGGALDYNNYLTGDESSMELNDAQLAKIRSTTKPQ
jgi:hypothetical protein